MRLDASHGFCLGFETQYVEVNDPFRIPTFAVGMYHDTRKDFDYMGLFKFVFRTY